jgi:hypothetical protein
LAQLLQIFVLNASPPGNPFMLNGCLVDLPITQIPAAVQWEIDLRQSIKPPKGKKGGNEREERTESGKDSRYFSFLGA